MKEIVKRMFDDWSYDKAVKTLIPEVVDWSKRSLKIARALYIANQKLAKPGVRTDLIENNKSTSSSSGSITTTLCQKAQGDEKEPTFEQFCKDIGIPRKTAYNWLQCYDPDKDYLFEVEEVQQMLQEEKNRLFESVRKERKKTAGYIPPVVSFKWNRKITKWNDKLESEYLVWLYDNKYSTINPRFQIPEDLPVDKYGQYGLWSESYLDSLTSRCIEETSGDNAEGFFKMVEKYEERIPKGVNQQDIIRIPVIVKASIRDLTPVQKRETTALLSEIIADMAMEEK